MKKRVVLFGTIPVANKCLQLLHQNYDVEIVGVVTDVNCRYDEEVVPDYASRNNIPILSLEDCMNLDVDIGFTIRFHKIIGQQLINQFKEGIINMHGGPLPNYRGSFCNIMAILNKEKGFGVTLHYIDAGIDTGDIIDVEYFDINGKDTGYSVFMKTLDLGYELFKKNIQSIINGTNKRIAQDEFDNSLFNGMYYTKRSDLEYYKKISFKDMNEHEILNRIKAFYFPNKESAYTLIQEEKVYLTLHR